MLKYLLFLCCRDVTKEVATPVDWVKGMPLEMVDVGPGSAEVRFVLKDPGFEADAHAQAYIMVLHADGNCVLHMLGVQPRNQSSSSAPRSIIITSSGKVLRQPIPQVHVPGGRTRVDHVRQLATCEAAMRIHQANWSTSHCYSAKRLVSTLNG